jgi:hypothetical protein
MMPRPPKKPAPKPAPVKGGTGGKCKPSHGGKKK